LLFLSIGTTIDVANERNVYVLRDGIGKLRDAGEKIPVTFICFVIGALAISAIPPLNGFVSKTAITYAMKGSLHYYLLSAAAVGTVASFIKLSRIFWPTANRGRPRIEMGDSLASGSIPQSKSQGFVARLTAQSLLAVLCVAGGLAAHHILTIVGTLFSSGGTNSAVLPVLYSSENLLKTGATTLGGILLFFIATSKPGSKVLHAIRNRPRSFQGLFVSFSLGTAVLAAFLLVGKLKWPEL